MSSILVIITGASRGIGRSCAISFATFASTHKNVKKIHLCLLARNVDGLEETVKLVEQAIVATRKNNVNQKTKGNNPEGDQALDAHIPEVTSSIQKVDLADVDTLEDTIHKILEENLKTSSFQSPLVKYDHFILINNAGSLGHLGKAKDISSPKYIQKNADLNIVSTCWLSSYFLQWFCHQTKLMSIADAESNSHSLSSSSSSATTYTFKTSKKCTIVNISSLCAISSFPTMAMYCAGKAYRDMYHQTLANEEKDNPSIQILNYAPGAIETNMTETLSQCEDLDCNLSAFYKERNDTVFVKVEDSTRKLVKLVMDGDFESGKHIDFWDDVNG